MKATAIQLGALVAVVTSCSAPDPDPAAGADAAVGVDAPAGCQAESLTALCLAASYHCGAASFTDRCGNHVEGSCGTCSDGTCGGAGVEHACSVPSWTQLQWPSLELTRIAAMWNTPGTSTVWVGGGALGSGEIWKIDDNHLGMVNVPRTVLGMHGVGDDVWAVGSSGMVIRGANGSFERVPSTDIEVYDLSEVWAFGRDDAWVTTNGINSAAHWNGTRWDLYMLPSTSLYPDCAGLWGAAPDDLWAACTKGELFHWNGTEWSKAASPTSQTLQALYGFASNDIWAVGNSNTLLHYDGSSWREVSAPTSGALIGIWGPAPNDVYAVGSKPLGGGRVIHFNGSSWREEFTTTTGEFDRVAGAQGRVQVIGYPGLLYTYP